MVHSTRRFVVCLTMCHFVLVFFGPFGIAVASLGEGRGMQVLVLFVRLFHLCLFGFVGFLFLLVSGGGCGGGGGGGCGLWLWHSMGFSLAFFSINKTELTMQEPPWNGQYENYWDREVEALSSLTRARPHPEFWYSSKLQIYVRSA